MELSLEDVNALIRNGSQEYHVRPRRISKKRVEFRGVRTLKSVERYVFYSPAMLYLWGRFSDTPLTDILSRVDVPILWHRFEKPLFRGLVSGLDASWNHVLWACPRDRWEEFSFAVIETAQVDTKRHVVYTYAVQEVTIYDPISIDNAVIFRPNETDRIQVQIFAVVTNKHQIAFSPTTKPHELPIATRFRPEGEFVRIADEFFAQPFKDENDALRRFRVIMESFDEQEMTKMRSEFLRRSTKGRDRGRSSVRR